MIDKNLLELYELVIDAMEDGIWDWDVPTGQAYFTPRYYEILGYKDKEFPATYEYWMSIIHPEDKIRVEKELQDGVASGKAFSIDVRLKMKDGKYRWFNTRGKTIETSEDGKAKRMVGTFSDISERKQIEQDLLTSRKQLEDKLQEAKKLNELTVDRELKMVQLKDRIKELESKIK